MRTLKLKTDKLNFEQMKDCDNEDERTTFYENVSRILDAAHDLEFVRPFFDDGETGGISHGEVASKIEKEIGYFVSRLDRLLSYFPSEADSFSSIYRAVGNLQSIVEVFSREHSGLARVARDHVDEASTEMKQKLEEYIRQPTIFLSTDEVLGKLLLLKSASIEIVCWGGSNQRGH